MQLDAANTTLNYQMQQTQLGVTHMSVNVTGAMSEFLTTRQLQEILHVDRTTIYRMVEDGRVPAVRVGNQWRFPRRAIESWLKTESEASVAADAGTASTVAGLANAGNAISIDKLLPAECVLKIQDAFADLLGVTLVLTNLAGEPLLPYSNLSGLLRLAVQSAAGQQWCEKEWAALATSPSVMPQLVRGHLGLLHTRGLVRVGSEIKAMVVAAGIAPEQWPPDECDVARLAELLDVDEKELRRQIGDVHRLDAAGQQNMLVHVQRVADIVAHIISERNLLFARLQHIADLSHI
jgi:excisionase family DNA binding protein